MIAFRLLSIAARKYSAEPDTRDSAARMLLLNALRLGVAHLGRKEAARLVLDALDGETANREGRACS